jgi:hypothetical protein
MKLRVILSNLDKNEIFLDRTPKTNSVELETEIVGHGKFDESDPKDKSVQTEYDPCSMSPKTYSRQHNILELTDPNLYICQLCC